MDNLIELIEKLQSEIDVNKSVAEANRAGAEKAGAETKTIEQQRDLLQENLKQQGVSQWLENIQNKYMMEADKNGKNEGAEKWYVNETYGESGGVNKESLFNDQATTAILKTLAETGNTEANTMLTNIS